MYIAKVVGTVVATRKIDTLKGIKLLLLQPLEDDLTPKDRVRAAGDAQGEIGEGDLVWVVTKKEAGFPFGGLTPLDHAVVGYIDDYHTEEIEEGGPDRGPEAGEGKGKGAGSKDDKEVWEPTEEDVRVAKEIYRNNKGRAAWTEMLKRFGSRRGKLVKDKMEAE